MKNPGTNLSVLVSEWQIQECRVCREEQRGVQTAQELGEDTQLSLRGEGEEIFLVTPGDSAAWCNSERCCLDSEQSSCSSPITYAKRQPARPCSCSNRFLFCFVSFHRFEFSLFKKYIVLLGVWIIVEDESPYHAFDVSTRQNYLKNLASAKSNYMFQYWSSCTPKLLQWQFWRHQKCKIRPSTWEGMIFHGGKCYWEVSDSNDWILL